MIEKSKDSIIEVNRSTSKFYLVDIIIFFQSHSFYFINEIFRLEQILSTSSSFRVTPFLQEISNLLESYLLIWVSFLICR